jgi:PIN domain nuclease of toxin-antitoxin system
VGIGKLKLPRTKPAELPSVAEKTGFTISALDAHSFASFNELPLSQHRDPFDRMLAWQAICENYVLVTTDEAFRDYRQAGLKTF